MEAVSAATMPAKPQLLSGRLRQPWLRPGVALLVLFAVMLAKCWLLTQGLGLDGRLTYVWAGWRYDEAARFDNTWPTWSTDYAVAALCLAWAARVRRGGARGATTTAKLRSRVAALLELYAASTALGGLVHMLHDGTHEALNRKAFRASWTIVVGLTVTAGSVLGLIGRELAQLHAGAGHGGGHQGLAAGGAPHVVACSRRWSPVRPWRCSAVSADDRRRAAPATGAGAAPAVLVDCRGGPAVSPLGPTAAAPAPTGLSLLLLPDSAWLAWGAALVVLVALGIFSCQRPACDVFVAGTSQALPTFYLQLVLLVWRGRLPNVEWWLLQASLVGNAPLVFIYPWFVQRSGLSLGTINAMLHGVLALSWGLQGLGLERVCRAADALSFERAAGAKQPEAGGKRA